MSFSYWTNFDGQGVFDSDSKNVFDSPREEEKHYYKTYSSQPSYRTELPPKYTSRYGDQTDLFDYTDKNWPAQPLSQVRSTPEKKEEPERDGLLPVQSQSEKRKKRLRSASDPYLNQYDFDAVQSNSLIGRQGNSVAPAKKGESAEELRMKVAVETSAKQLAVLFQQISHKINQLAGEDVFNENQLREYLITPLLGILEKQLETYFRSEEGSFNNVGLVAGAITLFADWIGQNLNSIANVFFPKVHTEIDLDSYSKKFQDQATRTKSSLIQFAEGFGHTFPDSETENLEKEISVLLNKLIYITETESEQKKNENEELDPADPIFPELLSNNIELPLNPTELDRIETSLSNKLRKLLSGMNHIPDQLAVMIMTQSLIGFSAGLQAAGFEAGGQSTEIPKILQFTHTKPIKELVEKGIGFCMPRGLHFVHYALTNLIKAAARVDLPALVGHGVSELERWISLQVELRKNFPAGANEAGLQNKLLTQMQQRGVLHRELPASLNPQGVTQLKRGSTKFLAEIAEKLFRTAFPEEEAINKISEILENSLDLLVKGKLLSQEGAGNLLQKLKPLINMIAPGIGLSATLNIFSEQFLSPLVERLLSPRSINFLVFTHCPPKEDAENRKQLLQDLTQWWCKILNIQTRFNPTQNNKQAGELRFFRWNKPSEGTYLNNWQLAQSLAALTLKDAEEGQEFLDTKALQQVAQVMGSDSFAEKIPISIHNPLLAKDDQALFSNDSETALNWLRSMQDRAEKKMSVSAKQVESRFRLFNQHQSTSLSPSKKRFNDHWGRERVEASRQKQWEDFILKGTVPSEAVDEETLREEAFARIQFNLGNPGSQLLQLLQLPVVNRDLLFRILDLAVENLAKAPTLHEIGPETLKARPIFSEVPVKTISSLATSLGIHLGKEEKHWHSPFALLSTGAKTLSWIPYATPTISWVGRTYINNFLLGGDRKVSSYDLIEKILTALTEKLGNPEETAKILYGIFSPPNRDSDLFQNAMAMIEGKPLKNA